MGEYPDLTALVMLMATTPQLERGAALTWWAGSRVGRVDVMWLTSPSEFAVNSGFPFPISLYQDVRAGRIYGSARNLVAREGVHMCGISVDFSLTS